jgi:hypothetical protein
MVFYLAAYLRFAPFLGAVNISDIDNLEAILHKMPVLATVAEPILGYEIRVLTIMGRG